MAWDGLDRNGDPPPPGELQVRALQTAGLGSELVANVGVNPLPFWEEGVGNHRGIEAVAAAPDDPEGLIVLAGLAEGGIRMARLRPDGSYAWAGVDNHAMMFRHFQLSSTQRVETHNVQWGYVPCGAVTVGDRVLVLRQDGRLYRLDAKTGAPVGEGLDVRIAAEDAEDQEGLSFDAIDSLAVISYRAHDAIRFVDWRSGSVSRELKAIRRPLGVGLDAQRRAYVISDGAILRIDQEGSSTFIPKSQLTAPWRLSVDRASGDLLVAENSLRVGAPVRHHQVKRFSPTGTLLQTYGRAEGRQDGSYVPTDFEDVFDIDALGGGEFALAEVRGTPSRAARFRRDGTLVREFLGAVPYGSRAEPEPDDPSRVWYVTHQGLVRAHVDYAKTSWRILETYRDVRDNPLVDLGNDGAPAGALLVLRAGGRTYVAMRSTGTLLLYDAERRTLRATNARGTQWTDNEQWKVPEELRGGDKALYPIRTGYIWSDRNDDGMPTFDELALFDDWHAGGPGTLVSSYERDLSLVFATGHTIRPALTTPGGAPVYRMEKLEKLPISGRDLFRSPGGAWYRTESGWGGPETHGIDWYPSLSGRDRLTKLGADFTEIWSVGRHTPTWDHEPGWSHRMEGIAGVTHGAVVVDGNFVDTEQIGPMVWTDDGLFVDELVANPVGSLPDWVYYGSRNEHARGKVIDDPTTGETLFFMHGNSGLPIWRITGWDGWRRAETAFSLEGRPVQAERAGTGLLAEYFANPEWAGTPLVSRIDSPINFDWMKEPPKGGLPARRFSVRWKGLVEAPLSEATFLVLRTGSNEHGRETSPVVRLWVDGQKVADSTERLGLEARNYRREYWKAPIQMEAGRRYAIVVEYADRGGKGPTDAESNYLNLCWDSPSIERETVDGAYLYPSARAGHRPLPLEGDPRLVGRILPIRSDRPQTVDAGTIARFRFDEGSGFVASSDIGMAVSCSVHGRSSWVPGYVDVALQLDGGICAVSPELRLPHTNYAVAFRFKTAAVSVPLIGASRKPTFHNNYDDSRISLADGKLVVTLDKETRTSASTFNDDRWHHVVLTVRQNHGFELVVDDQSLLKGTTDRLGLSHLWHVPTERLGLRLGPGDGRTRVAFDDLVVSVTAP